MNAQEINNTKGLHWTKASETEVFFLKYLSPIRAYLAYTVNSLSSFSS